MLVKNLAAAVETLSRLDALPWEISITRAGAMDGTVPPLAGDISLREWSGGAIAELAVWLPNRQLEELEGVAFGLDITTGNLLRRLIRYYLAELKHVQSAERPSPSNAIGEALASA